MDTEDRFYDIEGKLDRIFVRLENIEHVLGMNPSGVNPLDSGRTSEIEFRLATLEAKLGDEE